MTVWTAADIPDQSGRTFVVTGANSGLGAVTAKNLADAGATVVLACRDVAKGTAVASSIGKGARAHELDLADLASIRVFAESVDTVDVLINNAGVMAVPKRRTKDGFEMQIGTNHLGHFALTGLLLNKIQDRVVTLSSGLHSLGTVDIEDLNYQRRRYSRWRAYGQSKLANLLFAYGLERRLAASGSTVDSLAAHPGYASTNLAVHTESLQNVVLALAGTLFAQSAEMGALPGLFAATSPDVIGGLYIGPDGPGEQRGYPTIVGSNKKSHDEAVADALWSLSEELTGVVYQF